MRWVFIGIVVLNLVYLGVHLFSDASAPKVAAQVPQPTEFPQSLSLLDERPPAGTLPAAAAAVGGAVLQGCPALGPFPGEAPARDVAAVLSAGGFAAAPRSVNVPSATVYWVYLPPAAGREAALRRLRELHSRGIESFVVASGEDANAISLGTFQSRDSALGVQSRMMAAGYPAEIRPQVKDLRQFWVVLDSPAAQGFMELLAPAQADGLRLERLACGPAR